MSRGGKWAPPLVVDATMSGATPWTGDGRGGQAAGFLGLAGRRCLPIGGEGD